MNDARESQPRGIHTLRQPLKRATVTISIAIMSLEAARNLSIPDLLRVLDEKLKLEYYRLRNTQPPPFASVTLLESEVSMPQSVHPNKRSGGVLQ